MVIPIQEPNFYLFNYYDSLSDSKKLSLEHNHHFTKQKIDLHNIRKIFFHSLFSKVVNDEWVMEPQDKNFTYESKYHITDNPDTHKNLLDNKLETKLLHNNGYAYLDEVTTWQIKDNVRYRFNKYGFRCEEFTDTDCIAFLGCSHTFGTGLDQAQIWPEIVCKELGVRCVNLGLPARGIDLCSWYAQLFFKAEVKNCKAIVIMLPPPARKSSFVYNYDPNMGIETLIRQMEWLDSNLLGNYQENVSDFIKEIILSHKQNENLSHKELLAQDILDKHNTLMRMNSAVGNIENLANDLDIPLKTYSSFMDMNVGVAGNTDFARDNMHGGKELHREFAYKVITDLQQQLDK